jgi:hypothetical protein
MWSGIQLSLLLDLPLRELEAEVIVNTPAGAVFGRLV